MTLAVAVVAAAAVTVIVVVWVRCRARSKTAASRHAALTDIAGIVPPGSKVTAFEDQARTWVEIGPVSEVLDDHGQR